MLTGGKPKKKQHHETYASGENSKGSFELNGSRKIPPAKVRVGMQNVGFGEGTRQMSDTGHLRFYVACTTSQIL